VSHRGRLLLFDIDGTLLTTKGAGISALTTAFADVFAAEIGGRPLPEISFAGSTDSGIVRHLCRHFAFEAPEGKTREFYSEYLLRLRRNLAAQDPAGSGRLPGVLELLRHLTAFHPQHRLNLLTGNVQRGAWIKVEHYGLREFFTTGAFGDDHHDRNALCPVAVDREKQHSGRHFSPGEVVVIGDTPKDIACGKAHGARTLAVATGGFAADELAAHEPTATVGDFSDVAAVMEIIEAC